MVQSIGSCLKPWATVVEAIAGGTVPVSVAGGSLPLIDRIYVAPRELEPLLIIEPKTRVDADAGRPIVRSDVIEVLNLNAKYFHTLAVAANGQDVAPAADVLALARTFISPTEMTARWGTDGRTATALIKRIMPRINRQPLGWPRDEVEAIADKLIAAGRHRRPS